MCRLADLSPRERAIVLRWNHTAIHPMLLPEPTATRKPLSALWLHSYSAAHRKETDN